MLPSLVLSLLVSVSPLQATQTRRVPVAPSPARGAVTAETTVDLADVPLDQGSYTLEDFQIGPSGSWNGATGLGGPRHGGLTPSGRSNPLGRNDIVLNELDECALFMPSYASPSGVAWIREDFRQGQGIVPGTSFTSSNLGQILDAAVGNIDADAEDEIVLLQQPVGSALVNVVRVDRQANGSFLWTQIDQLAGDTFTAHDGRIALGDFDADQRDEIAVTLSASALGTANQRSLLRVLDDPDAGAGEMLSFSRTDNHVAMWPMTADLDGDGQDELVLVLEGNATNSGALSVRTFHGERGATVFPSTQPQADWVVLTDTSNAVGAKLAVGNFDDDPAEEVMCVSMLGSSPLSPTQIRLRPFQYAGGVWSLIGGNNGITYNSSSTGASLRGNAWDVAAVDRDGNGRDEVAVLRGRPGSNLVLDLFVFAGTSWVSVTPVQSLTIPRAAVSESGLALASGDGDSDGAEDLYFAVLEGTASTRPFLYGNLTGSGNNQPALYSFQNLAISGASHAPVLAPGDLDADGLRVRYTGNTELRVSDPIPLVLLEAAPTKAGTDQNYDASQASYSLSTSSSQAVGVSVGIAVSASVGFEAELLPGLLGVSAKATMEVAFNRTQTVAVQSTFVQGFSGSHDADVLVFVGPLFRSSEYEVVSNPSGTLVGSRFFVDVPLATNTYKWTVDYYNPRVRPEYRLDSTVLTHTIGAPETYPTRAQMQQRVNTWVGWIHPASTPVGQGSGSNQLGISLASELATDSQLEASLSLEAEFKIGGATFGAGVTLSGGVMYSVATSHETIYEGSVGDIGPAGYAQWSYDFGLAVYQLGRLADAQNQPVGWAMGHYPLTVVGFWTRPTGSGY